jgi:hypothetical protein
MVFIVTVGAFLSNPTTFGAVAAAGVVVAVFLIVVTRHRNRISTGNGVRLYGLVAGLVLVASVVCVALSVISSLSADVAVGITAGAGVWILLEWWAQWWNEERPVAVDLSDGNSDPVPTTV